MSRLSVVVKLRLAQSAPPGYLIQIPLPESWPRKRPEGCATRAPNQTPLLATYLSFRLLRLSGHQCCAGRHKRAEYARATPLAPISQPHPPRKHLRHGAAKRRHMELSVPASPRIASKLSATKRDEV